jgi:hypothetical protein
MASTRTTHSLPSAEGASPIPGGTSRSRDLVTHVADEIPLIPGPSPGGRRVVVPGELRRILRAEPRLTEQRSRPRSDDRDEEPVSIVLRSHGSRTNPGPRHLLPPGEGRDEGSLTGYAGLTNGRPGDGHSNANRARWPSASARNGSGERPSHPQRDEAAIVAPADPATCPLG